VPSYTVSGLTCGSTYTLGVVAVDAAGNASGQATTTAATAPCPTSLPSSTATVFVASSGSDTNLCTQTSPCRTFDRAYALAQPGQTVEIAGGTYPGQTINAKGTEALTSTYITFRPAAGATVTINGELRVSGAAWLEFDNMTIGDWYAGINDNSSPIQTHHLIFRNDTVGLFYITGASYIHDTDGADADADAHLALAGDFIDVEWIHDDGSERTNHYSVPNKNQCKNCHAEHDDTIDAIGLKARHRRLFEDIAWSTDRVAEHTLARAAEIGLAVHLLPAWYDVDDAQSLSVLYGELFEDRPFSRRHDRHRAASSARLMRTMLARSDLAARLDIVPRPAIAAAAG
jgi:hypothetical protein